MNCPLLMEKAAHCFLNEPEAILKSASFDFVDAYMHAYKNGPRLLISLVEAFFARHGKKVLPLYGKRIAKSYMMSHRLLTVSTDLLPENDDWMPAALLGHSLDSLRRKLHDEGLDFEGSREVLTDRLDNKVPDWKKNTDRGW